MADKKLDIGLLLVSTGKYDVFLKPLIESLEKYFFVDDKVTIYLFWDKDYKIKVSKRFSIIYIPVQHKPFPFATLYRYKYFTSVSDKINSDYLFYIDVDMLLVNNVGREILPDMINDCGLVATAHCGFWSGGGSWETNTNSRAFTLERLRKRYYAGGFQGGRTDIYLSACSEMSKDIDDDERRGVIAVWNDESHFNKYLSTRNPKMLTPEYCQVEEKYKRIKWGVAHFEPRIIALAKDHDKIRS